MYNSALCASPTCQCPSWHLSKYLQCKEKDWQHILRLLKFGKTVSVFQTAELKAAAEREMRAVNEAINQQISTAQGGPQSADSATAPLRARLNRAIEVMQEGLIERDTEVSSSTIFEALHCSLSAYSVSEAFYCLCTKFGLAAHWH